jgi:hypothetical protein
MRMANGRSLTTIISKLSTPVTLRPNVLGGDLRIIRIFSMIGQITISLETPIFCSMKGLSHVPQNTVNCALKVRFIKKFIRYKK